MSIIEELRDVVGDEATERLCDYFGGERIYIPQRVPVDPLEIKGAVEALRASGSPAKLAYRTVAEEHNLSVSTVLRLLKS